MSEFNFNELLTKMQNDPALMAKFEALAAKPEVQEHVKNPDIQAAAVDLGLDQDETIAVISSGGTRRAKRGAKRSAKRSAKRGAKRSAKRNAKRAMKRSAKRNKARR